MFKIVLAIFSVYLVLSDCALIQRGFKVYNGEKITEWTKNPFKFIVMLAGKSLCTGSIFTPTVVLSAGHCFMNRDRLPTFVVPEHAVTNGPIEKAISIAKVSVPREYTQLYAQEAVNGEDCSVIKLRQPISDVTKQYTILPFRATTPTLGTEVVIVGYGRDSFTNEKAGQLKHGKTLVSKCRDSAHDQRICIAALQTYKSQITEQGDSGGPILGVTDAGEYYGLGMCSGGVFYSDDYTEVVYSTFIRHEAYINAHTGN